MPVLDEPSQRDSVVAPVRPAPADGASFAAIPATVRRLLAGTPGGLDLGALDGPWERVLLVLIDGLGMVGLERHGDHPLVARLRDEGVLLALTTQFPSTTTAHITTLHTGLPVGEHGLYEWNVLEPSLDRIVRPLMFAASDDADAGRGSLATSLDPATLVAGPSLYDDLADANVGSTLHQPAVFSPSAFDRAVATGAVIAPFRRFTQGLREAAAVLDEAMSPSLAYVYDADVDGVGHLHGPESDRWDALVRRRLDQLEATLADLPSGTLVLLCSDHGQEHVDPTRVDHLDELWPPLAGLLEYGPAGSARDVFLHVPDDAVDEVVGELGAVLGERAEVHATADLVAEGLFGQAGPRLLERLAPVCVLPGPGRMAWLRSHPGPEGHFLGHHGGLLEREARTFLGAVAV